MWKRVIEDPLYDATNPRTKEIFFHDMSPVVPLFQLSIAVSITRDKKLDIVLKKHKDLAYKNHKNSKSCQNLICRSHPPPKPTNACYKEQRIKRQFPLTSSNFVICIPFLRWSIFQMDEQRNRFKTTCIVSQCLPSD